MRDSGPLPRRWLGWRVHYLPYPIVPDGQYQAWRYGLRVHAKTRESLAARIEHREALIAAPVRARV